ncbi:MAG: hypothetical protein ACKVI4_14855 [Actinomycetales bacterium]
MSRGKEVTITESRCHPCLKQYNHEYFTSDEFRKNNNERHSTNEYLAYRKEYRKRDHVVEQEEEYRTSDAGRQSSKRRKGRYHGSDKWRVAQDECNTRRREKYAESELLRINTQLSCAVANMVRGFRQTSRSLYSYTEFVDATDLMDHLSKGFRGNMTSENFGKVWQIEHRVAKCWYAKTEEDIQRCWSKANIAPEFGPENMKKGIKIIDKYCNQVGAANFPQAWGGLIPTPEERKRMYRSVMVR